jgi:hypothetical protein
MNKFRTAAIEILKSNNKPLHYKEITRLAIEKGILNSAGKTPWASMNAQLSTDIVENGEKSIFRRTDPGFFSLQDNTFTTTETISVKARIVKHTVNSSLNSIQKGSIAEARVAELITLYGDEGLSCYRPITDDEGIDIIVKKRGKLEVVYVQVKSTYGYGVNDRGFVSTVKEKSLMDKARLLVVFVYFDLSKGDLYDHVFCIPAPEFLKLTENEVKQTGDRVFSVGLKNPDQSKYSEFMIEKRELANKILEIMSRI